MHEAQASNRVRQEERRGDGRPQVHRPARACGSTRRVPIQRLDGEAFEEGFGFDGSSIRGWQPINQSDMLMMPDPTTAVIDPFTQAPDAVAALHDSGPDHAPALLARSALHREEGRGVPQVDRHRRHRVLRPRGRVLHLRRRPLRQPAATAPSTTIDSDEADWNTGRDEGPNLGYKIRHKEGYFPVPPTDTLTDLRTEMVLAMQAVGIEVEVSHHEVATAGQCEIDMKFDSLVTMADKLMWFKYVVKNVARKHGKTATFMPKPLFGDNGSGMHCHQSLWKDGKPLFAGDGYAGLSEHGALLHRRHPQARARRSRRSPTRPRTATAGWCPGFEAPVNLAYSSRNRSASIRIPMYSPSPKAKRLEVRFPDPTLQPVPRVRRDDDGRPRRHPEQDRPGRSARQGHLRALARGAQGRAAHAGLARRGARRARARPRVPARRATCSRATSSRPGSTTSASAKCRRCGSARTRSSFIFTTISRAESRGGGDAGPRVSQTLGRYTWWSAEGGRGEAGNGRWETGGGKREVGNGRRKTGGGKREAEKREVASTFAGASEMQWRRMHAKTGSGTLDGTGRE